MSPVRQFSGLKFHCHSPSYLSLVGEAVELWFTGEEWRVFVQANQQETKWPSRDKAIQAISKAMKKRNAQYLYF